MAFLVGALAAGVPTAWVATRFQERTETKIAAIRVRLSLLETSHAQCSCEPNSTKRLLGDFPPWYGTVSRRMLAHRWLRSLAESVMIGRTQLTKTL